MKRIFFCTLIMFGLINVCVAAVEYNVEKVLENGEYIINGVAWKPHSACKKLQKGDKVTFIEGNANGDCVSAIISDVNSKTTCKLWCSESPNDE